MAKGEITLDETRCQGCAYCAIFCSKGCITWPTDRFTSGGHILPAFSDPSTCTGCGNCGRMCPSYAIEVYRFAAPKP